MKNPRTLLFAKKSFLLAIMIMGGAWNSLGQTIAIHASSERSGAQGNLLQFSAQHTGNLPSAARMYFYVVNPSGVTENLGSQGTAVGNLWWMPWTAKAPGTYQLYAILRDGFSESAPEVARSASVPVTITGSAIAIHTSSERSGAQGNLLQFSAQHTGNLPSAARMYFYVVNPSGVTENLGSQGNAVGNLWWMSWTAKAPGTYQLYAILRDGFSESAPEVARSASVPVTITGSAIAIHTSSERTGAQGNELQFSAQHTGNLPSAARMYFYVVNPSGVTENLGSQGNAVGNLWWMPWTAKAPGTYQLYAILRDGFSESAPEVARSASVPITITGSAIAMHSSSARTFVAGRSTQAVAVTFGRLPSSARVYFYAVDTATERTLQLGSEGNPVNQLWYKVWTPEVSSTYFIYAVLRSGFGENAPEIARSGNFTIVPQGTSIPLPFEAVAGSYQALLSGPSRPMLTVQLSANGAITGRMLVDGLAYAFKGTMGADGTVTLPSDLRQQPSLVLVLRSDYRSRMVTGYYRFGAQEAVEFGLLPAAYSGTGSDVSALNRKTANVLLAPELEAGRGSLGYGFARATFDAKGGARLAGLMPDGRKVSSYVPALSSGIPGELVLPVFVAWKGSVMATLKGEMEIKEAATGTVPLLEGSLEWIVPADAKRPVLPAAFRANFSALGNLWSPSPGANVLTGASGAADFRFEADPEGRILGAAGAATGTWANNNVAAFTGLPSGSTWTFSAKTGIFSGKFASSGGSYVFTGLLVPASGIESGERQLRGAGFMLGKGLSTAVEITTAE